MAKSRLVAHFSSCFTIVVIFTLIVINLRQANELRELEQKTLDAFRIVCKKLKQSEVEKNARIK